MISEVFSLMVSLRQFCAFPLSLIWIFTGIQTLSAHHQSIRMVRLNIDSGRPNQIGWAGFCTILWRTLIMSAALADIDDAFIRDICITPGDDTPRLIYADYLEDYGDKERAEFIRLQVNMERQHQLSGGMFIETEEYEKLHKRER